MTSGSSPGGGPGRFTFHVGRMCGGGVGFLFRWFGAAQSERFRVGWSSNQRSES